MSANRLEKNDELWLRLQFKVFEKKITKCFVLFRKNGIEPILIKGWAISQYYPQSWKRITTDIDLCIEPDLFEKAMDLIRSDEGRTLTTDIHKGVKHLDTLSWDELFEKSFLIDLNGVEIRVLSKEEHLRILCVHWLKDGGGYRDKLWDIYYLIENRGDDFDWDRCLNSVSKIRRRWIICTIGLAHRYLGLDLDNIPIRDEAMDLPKWLIKAVENEWKSDVRIIDITIFRNNPRQLFQQIRKRIPPNPIQATINLEGDFDKGLRIYYQILNIFQRFSWSVKRFISSRRK